MLSGMGLRWSVAAWALFFNLEKDNKENVDKYQKNICTPEEIVISQNKFLLCTHLHCKLYRLIYITQKANLDFCKFLK